MLELKRILFPVDFSAKCKDAAHAVRTLAIEFKAEIVLLNVVETFEEEMVYAKDDIAARVTIARKRLETFLCSEFKDLQTRTVVLKGYPAELIVDYAHREKMDLIMMPTHGYGMFRRFLLGSVTSKVLHDSNVPVWTGTHLGADAAQKPNPELKNIRKVICAIDLGPESCKTALWAANLAKRFEADLMLVHAIPVFTAPTPEAWPVGWQEEALRFAEEQMEGLLQHLKLECPVRVLQGSAPFAIREAVKEWQADLLVIGRTTHTGIIGRLSSDAYGILCHSPSSVVSV